MSSLNKLPSTLRAIIIGLALVCLFIGFLIGRVGRDFENAGPEHLGETYLDLYVTGLSSRYSQNPNDETPVKHGLCYGNSLETVKERLASGAIDGNPSYNAAYQQVISIAEGNGGCAAYVAAPNTDQQPVANETAVDDAGVANNSVGTADEATVGSRIGSILQTLAAIIVVGAIIGGLAWFFLNQRKTDNGGQSVRVPRIDNDLNDAEWERVSQPTETSDRIRTRASAPASRPAPTATIDPSQPQPIGGFSTTYTRGDDAFDKSFIIENSNGDFLGECGVSISEYVNTDDGARNVTAFEIWLFDKNDTHTVTKVLMSDYAFRDEATRAKLAVRGDSVKASHDETVALETNALIINANVNDLVYAETKPELGVFDRFTIDLSAWVKSQMEQSTGTDTASASDLLNF